MYENRRELLKSLGFGAVLSAGVLLPSEALARCRRRETSCVIEPVKYKPMMLGGEILLSYPYAEPDSSGKPYLIYGKGSFCMWGEFLSPTATYEITDIVFNYASGPGPGTEKVIVDPATPVTPCRWAYAVKGVTKGQVFGISFLFKKNGVTQSPLPFGPFMCADAFEGKPL